MNNRWRKTKNVDERYQVAIVIFVLLLLAILIGGTFREMSKSNEAEREYYRLKTEQTHYEAELKAIKPKVTAITSGKFDLQGQERKLENNYQRLTIAIMGQKKPESFIDSNKELYYQYFGEEGTKKIKDIAYSHDRNIAERNLDTKVMFSNFDLQNQTIDVAIYSKFALNKNSNFGYAKYGLFYCVTKFSFQKNAALKSSIQSAFPTKD